VLGDREGEFVTELFERYKRMTGDVEEVILKSYGGAFLPSCGVIKSACGPIDAAIDYSVVQRS
jgi:hypothetical protein